MIDRYALLIGAMKAGTTALFKYLAQHPEIAACKEKEPNTLCNQGSWREGLLEEYEALWDWDPARHRWALEASTAYTKMPVRPSAATPSQRIPAEFRFLYMTRDPIARLRSQYLHSLAEGFLDKGIDEWLAPEAVLFSNYRFQLTPYVATHGRESIRVLSYEAFCREPRAVLREVCEFLGIDPDFAFTDPGPQNSGSMYRGKLLARIANERGVLAEPLDLDRSAKMPYATLRHSLGNALAARGHAGLLDELEAQLERWITPTPAQEARVRELLDEDLGRFREEWGVDAWTGDVDGAGERLRLSAAS